jgi:hypothetical protein
VAKALAAQPVPVSLADAFAFAGGAPEAANGRLAMLGFVAGAAAELQGAGPLAAQLQAHGAPLAALAVTLVLATVVPVMKGSVVQRGPFTRAAEETNGRLAMLAILAQAVLEATADTPGATFF